MVRRGWNHYALRGNLISKTQKLTPYLFVYYGITDENMASRNVNAFLQGKVESLKTSENLDAAQIWTQLEELYTRKYVISTHKYML